VTYYVQQMKKMKKTAQIGYGRVLVCDRLSAPTDGNERRLDNERNTQPLRSRNSLPQTSAAMLSIYDGRTCVGFILKRGKAGVEALDANCTSLGLFATEPAAVDAEAAFSTLKPELDRQVS
jgi:hypothetical protein